MPGPLPRTFLAQTQIIKSLPPLLKMRALETVNDVKHYNGVQLNYIFDMPETTLLATILLYSILVCNSRRRIVVCTTLWPLFLDLPQHIFTYFFAHTIQDVTSVFHWVD